MDRTRFALTQNGPAAGTPGECYGGAGRRVEPPDPSAGRLPAAIIAREQHPAKPGLHSWIAPRAPPQHPRRPRAELLAGQAAVHPIAPATDAARAKSRSAYTCVTSAREWPSTT